MYEIGAAAGVRASGRSCMVTGSGGASLAAAAGVGVWKQ